MISVTCDYNDSMIIGPGNFYPRKLKAIIDNLKEQTKTVYSGVIYAKLQGGAIVMAHIYRKKTASGKTTTQVYRTDFLPSSKALQGENVKSHLKLDIVAEGDPPNAMVLVEEFIFGANQDDIMRVVKSTNLNAHSRWVSPETIRSQIRKTRK